MCMPWAISDLASCIKLRILLVEFFHVCSCSGWFGLSFLELVEKWQNLKCMFLWVWIFLINLQTVLQSYSVNTEYCLMSCLAPFFSFSRDICYMYMSLSIQTVHWALSTVDSVFPPSHIFLIVLLCELKWKNCVGVSLVPHHCCLYWNRE